jgi:hypothetical protein
MPNPETIARLEAKVVKQREHLAGAEAALAAALAEPDTVDVADVEADAPSVTVNAEPALAFAEEV